MSIETNTPAQNERLRKVRAMLAEGRNPYASDPNEETKTVDAGGLEQDRERLRNERLAVVEERSQAVMERNAKKWAERQTVTGRVYLDIDMRQEFKEQTFPAPVGPTITTPDGRVISDPDMFCCSFCDTWLHRSKVTTGKGDMRRSKIMEVTMVNGVEVVTEKVVYSSPKVVACPDCVLHIKPTVHKDGSITNNINFSGCD